MARCPCSGELVPCCDIKERTIMVPMVITETRMKQCVVWTTKEREESYTAFRLVPDKREYKRKSCHLATEVKTQDIIKKQCRSAQVPTTLSDTVCEPVKECRTGVRHREACVDGCKVCVEEPCTCAIDRAVEVPRVRDYCRTEIVFEECKKTIDYCVKTPKFDEEVCAVEDTFRIEPVEKKRTVKVRVPEVVDKPCDFRVTRMVQKRIVCCTSYYESLVAEQERAKQCQERHAKLEGKAAACGEKAGKMAENAKQCAEKFAPQKVASCLAKHVAALNPLKLVPGFDEKLDAMKAGHKHGRKAGCQSCN